MANRIRYTSKVIISCSQIYSSIKWLDSPDLALCGQQEYILVHSHIARQFSDDVMLDITRIHSTMNAYGGCVFLLANKIDQRNQAT